LLAFGERRTTSISGDRLPGAEWLGGFGALGDGPGLLFENTAVDDAYGRLALVPLNDAAGARQISEMQCDRVDYRAGRGVCLRTNRGIITSYEAIVFDHDLREGYRVQLAGAPSRVRISPSGAYASVTVFVTGHSYAIDGFSTQTLILDLNEERVLGDLEIDFEVERDGKTWREIDFNFWGVTFEDGDDHFFATLGTQGDYYLVEGQLSDRRMSVVRSGVECPSLSPDGTRVAFKIRSDPGLGPATWRIGVLDLATMEQTILAETRNVDDQVAWLDDSTIMYGLRADDSPAEADTWAVPADGSGEPRLLVSNAWSAVVVDAS
jgi:hypothetical protein